MFAPDVTAIFAKQELMKRRGILILIGWALVLAEGTANDILPGREPSGPILLHGGTVHPVAGPSIARGKVLIDGERIVAVGREDAAWEREDGASKISFAGQHLYPGLISANGTLGLVEISAVRATRDLTEPGPINPSVRAEIAVNPDSELLPVARANGILTTLTVPQTNGLISGRSALLQLDGWTWEEMVLKAPVGMHLFWPRMRQRGMASRDERKAWRERTDKDLAKLRGFFEDARAYQKAKQARREDFRTDVRLEAMLPVLEKRWPVYVHALGVIEIQSALQFVQANQLKAVLVSGQDVWRVADLIKAREIPVILSTVQELPLRRWEAHDTARRVPAKLLEKEIPFCIANGSGSSGSSSARNLPYVAASAVGEGFTPTDALKSVTLHAAEILGVGEELGSIEAGKRATLMVTDGHPMEITTSVKRAFISGREIDLANKHTRLYDKYQEKQRRLSEEGR